MIHKRKPNKTRQNKTKNKRQTNRKQNDTQQNKTRQKPPKKTQNKTKQFKTIQNKFKLALKTLFSITMPSKLICYGLIYGPHRSLSFQASQCKSL